MRESIGQVLRYILTGGMTTMVNYVIYYGLLSLKVDYLTGNSLAWIGAVLFAYFANRSIVFQCEGHPYRQFFSFISLRLLTLVVETLSLLVLVDVCGISALLSKVMVSIITVLLNYFACKYHVFREGDAAHE